MNDGVPPRPERKAVRSTLVDSGWSAIPPAAADVPLVPDLPPPRPPADQEAGEHALRVNALRDKDTVPPPRRSGFPPNRSSTFPPKSASAAPPALPPPPSMRAPEPPLPAASAAEIASPPAPPPPVAPRSVLPPPPATRPAPPPSRPAPPVQPTAPATAADTNPGHQAAVAARSAATVVRSRTSQNPPALPSFAAALRQRVRFAGGEVPLWSLVTPLVLLVALGAGFAAAAVTSAADPGAAQAALKPAPEPSASTPPVLPAPLPPAPASADEKPKPLSPLERVTVGDDAALKELSAKPPPELRVEEAIALSLGQSAQAVRAGRALRDRVEHDPGLIKDQEVLAQLRRNTEDPETARDALAAMANVPGPISADLIYEVWTATASHTTASDLARSLIYSKEVRAKASKALSVALDLRDADTCEKNRDLLPRASSDGDRRASHLLNKLTRKYGCGANKRLDCYACLRDGKALDDAIKDVKARREPRPFGG